MRTDLSEIEKSIGRKLAGASYPPATASKRFARDLGAGYIRQLSPNGRRFMAYMAHRFRRQYQLTESEWAWVREWLAFEPQPAPMLPEPLRSMLDSLPRSRSAL